MRNNNFSCFVVLFLVIFLRGMCYEDENEKEDIDDERPSGRCQIDRRSLRNGRIKLRSRGRIVKFVCDPGYELAGKRFATCVMGRWNNPVPVCVARGCYRQRPVPNGQITEMYRGAMLLFTCNPGYTLQGSESIFCDGRSWNTTAPECVVVGSDPKMSCDFENRDLCGWSHDPHNDFDWKRNQFTTPSGHVGTGPSYDHTFGLGKGGFYLYMEASSPRRLNDTARLFSPVYKSNYSDSCFVFWYHMFGATTGGLRVYMKPERHVFGELLPVWEKWGDQGNQWMRGHIAVNQLHDNFQIVIEGVRGASYVGDSAIDDVKLTKGTCEDVDNSTDTVSHTEAGSCRGRCGEPDEEASCGCNENCNQDGNCCTDFSTICSSGNDTYVMNPDEPLPDDEIGTTSSLATVKLNDSSSLITSEIGTNSESTASTTPFTTSIAAANATISTTSTTATAIPLYTTQSTQITVPKTTAILSTPTTVTNVSTSSTSTTLSTSKLITRTATLMETNATSSVSSTNSSEISLTQADTSTSTSTIVPEPVTEAHTFVTLPSSTTEQATNAETTFYTETQSPVTSNTLSTVIVTVNTPGSTNTSLVSTEGSSPTNTTQVEYTNYSSTTLPTTTTTSITSTSSTRKTYNLRPRTRKTSPVTYFRTTTSSTSTSSSTSTTSRHSTESPKDSTTPSKYEYHVFDTTMWLNHTHRAYTSLESNQPSATDIYSSKMTPRTIMSQITTTSSTPTTEYFLNHASQEASTSNTGGLPTVTVVSISVVTILCAAGGLVFYMRKQKSKRQSKLSDDSEMRFLSENEISEYSDASALDKILVH